MQIVQRTGVLNELFTTEIPEHQVPSTFREPGYWDNINLSEHQWITTCNFINYLIHNRSIDDPNMLLQGSWLARLTLDYFSAIPEVTNKRIIKVQYKPPFIIATYKEGSGYGYACNRSIIRVNAGSEHYLQ